MCNEFRRSNRGSAIQWERVGKYQPNPVTPFGSCLYRLITYKYIEWLCTLNRKCVWFIKPFVADTPIAEHEAKLPWLTCMDSTLTWFMLSTQMLGLIYGHWLIRLAFFPIYGYLLHRHLGVKGVPDPLLEWALIQENCICSWHGCSRVNTNCTALAR